ncbi:hypothetical protein JB92DRAFT_3125235 [Gautieria morchelliformis]|nr:hypothetical protein JB92DRAFT_3125235 [Gautieria morchelliformis]
MGVFDNFVSLDGLIQVLYHSTSCFVLISNLETAAWVVELGLVGNDNRWWRGSWSENDVLKVVGSKVSEDGLEKFSDKLANFIIAGELSIGNWNANNSETGIKLQINPSDKAHVAIHLAEVPAEEAAPRAITILKGIALQAQSRGCRVNGGSQTFTPSVTVSKPSGKSRLPAPKTDDKELQIAQERIKRLETEVRQAVVEKLDASPSKPTARKPPPGASRANPTRQKRKIVQAEFESD